MENENNSSDNNQTEQISKPDESKAKITFKEFIVYKWKVPAIITGSLLLILICVMILYIFLMWKNVNVILVSKL